MNVAAVAKIIRETGNVHVSVYEGSRISDNSKPAFCSADYTEDIDKMSANDAATHFENFMADAFPGKYVARIMKGSKSGASARQLLFEKPAESVNQGPSVSGNNYSIGALQQQMDEKWQAKLDALKRELEMKELRAKIRGYEEDLKEARQPGARMVAFGEWLVGYLHQQKVLQVAGPGSQSDPRESDDESAHTEDDKDVQQEANRLLNEIADALGEDTLLLLRKLAALPPDALKALAHVDQHKITLALSYLK